MPGTLSDTPSVSLSFANNFWGKDDAGVSPLLERMHNAKVTSEEMKSFYATRAAIEDEYARKLLSLSRKPLGSSEAGTLRMSLDVVRAELESMGKQHQNIAQQMKSELDESLSAFAGGMKERRKIVQNGVEKLLKLKTQQTIAVNKARDRYEQDCLKIKGYLAQGHMVMGQEERKNKAKLEKTQLQLSTTSSEYEQTVKNLEETTGKWNRDWKAACDKFQDLEEERIDFMKSSLWSFANIASTVCVSDDASCEKIRLSLEDCDVEKDISSFIRECGTGQEIPDPPKFIDFCRGDINDAFSEIDEDGNYSVAQFQRTVNPAYRSSTPQPSPLESRGDSQHDVLDVLMQPHPEYIPRPTSTTPRKPVPTTSRIEESRPASRANQIHQAVERKDFAAVPHNEYPMDGMTQFCRIGPHSANSSVVSPARPASRESQSHSEYSQTTSLTSVEPSLLSLSPTKQLSDLSASSGPPEDFSSKKSGLFQNRSPFRRKSTKEKDHPQRPLLNPSTGQRAGYPPLTDNSSNVSPTRQQNFSNAMPSSMQFHNRPSLSPEPADPRAQFQLNIGNNVFDVASPDAPNNAKSGSALKDNDPIAQALAELKNVTKQSTVRQSADRYHGLATPAPDSSQGSLSGNRRPQAVLTTSDKNVAAAQRGTPPPTYDQSATNRLGAPQPAFTSRQMQQTTQKYIDQKQNMFNSPTRPTVVDQQQPPSQRTTPQAKPGAVVPQTYNNRAISPVPLRSASPRPGLYEETSMPLRPRAQSTSPAKPVPGGSWRGYGEVNNSGSPGQYQQQQQQQTPGARSVSPQPQFNRSANSVSPSSQGMALQLATIPQQQQQQQQPPPQQGGYSLHTQQSQSQLRGRPPGGGGVARPVSQYGNPGVGGNGAGSQHARSRSAAPEGRQQQFTRDGRLIMHFARAVYMYQAAIPEEISFAKGDVLAVIRHQDDGWWEAEVPSSQGRARRGLAPSNYLTPC